MKKTRFLQYNIAIITIILQSGFLFCAPLRKTSQLLSLNLTKNEKTSPTLESAQSHDLVIDIDQTSEKNIKTSKLSKTNDEIYPSLRMFAEVIDLIEQKGYSQINFKKFIEEALKAALPYCDAHSAFFTKQSYRETIESTSGEFSGVGVSVIIKELSDDWIIITDVVDGGPCDKAGIQAGDKIVEIDGKKLRSISSDEVINMLRGQNNSKVTIKIIRNNKPLDKIFVVTRDTIKNEVASAYYFKDFNIYYISLKLFSDNAAENVAQYLKKAIDAKCKGIILDLSGNPGGILESAVDVASLFVDKGSLIVSTKDHNRKVVSEYKTKTKPLHNKKIPIFVLINNFTASASEILAGSLKHYSKLDNQLNVFLVGMESFGKGSVQEVIPLSNGCALKLTTMLYYLPDGKSIQPFGIKPDFVIKPKITPEEDLKWLKEFYGTETSLNRHITREESEGKPPVKKDEPIVEKEEKEQTWEEKFKIKLHQSMPLRTAINMINLLDIVSQATPQKVDTRQKAIKFLENNFVTDAKIKIEKVK
jgi:carboxyl-terminal processing protease